MSEDYVEGRMKKADGKLEDAWGGLTGDESRQAKGKVDQVASSAQDLAGQAKSRSGGMYDEIESYAKDEPAVALGVALTIGVVVGFLLHGGRKTVPVGK